jgi:hypothetical protein
VSDAPLVDARPAPAPKPRARAKGDALHVGQSSRADAVRLLLHERASREDVAARFGVGADVVSAWMMEPSAVSALQAEAWLAAMLGVLRLEDDIQRLREIADHLQAEGELTAAAQATRSAADLELRRSNGAAKVVADALQSAGADRMRAPPPAAGGVGVPWRMVADTYQRDIVAAGVRLTMVVEPYPRGVWSWAAAAWVRVQPECEQATWIAGCGQAEGDLLPLEQAQAAADAWLVEYARGVGAAVGLG